MPPFKGIHQCGSSAQMEKFRPGVRRREEDNEDQSILFEDPHLYS